MTNTMTNTKREINTNIMTHIKRKTRGNANDQFSIVGGSRY